MQFRSFMLKWLLWGILAIMFIAGILFGWLL
jgi:hypothetical protein